MTWAKRIGRTPLAWPMALLMAGAVGFAAFAAPAALVERLSGAAGPSARPLLMIVAAAVAGAAVWLLFHRIETGSRRRGKPPAADAAMATVAPPPRVPLFSDAEPETAATTPEPEPQPEPESEPADPEPAPMPEPAPLPMAPPPVAGLIDRLERGLAARTDAPDEGAPVPRDRGHALRHTLDQLRRIAAHH